MEKHKLDVIIPIYHYGKMKEIKEKVGISFGEIVRRALEDFFKKHDKNM